MDRWKWTENGCAAEKLIHVFELCEMECNGLRDEGVTEQKPWPMIWPDRRESESIFLFFRDYRWPA